MFNPELHLTIAPIFFVLIFCFNPLCYYVGLHITIQTVLLYPAGADSHIVSQRRQIENPSPSLILRCKMEGQPDPESIYTKQACIGMWSLSRYRFDVTNASIHRLGGGSFGRVYKGYGVISPPHTPQILG